MSEKTEARIHFCSKNIYSLNKSIYLSQQNTYYFCLKHLQINSEWILYIKSYVGFLIWLFILFDPSIVISSEGSFGSMLG